MKGIEIHSSVCFWIADFISFVYQASVISNLMRTLIYILPFLHKTIQYQPKTSVTKTKNVSALPCWLWEWRWKDENKTPTCLEKHSYVLIKVWHLWRLFDYKLSFKKSTSRSQAMKQIFAEKMLLSVLLFLSVSLSPWEKICKTTRRTFKGLTWEYGFVLTASYLVLNSVFFWTWRLHNRTLGRLGTCSTLWGLPKA